jgi:ribosomal protein L40E
MKSTGTIARHAIAAILSLLVLMLTLFIVNPILDSLVTGETSEASFDAPAFICCCSVGWLVAVIMPISAAGEVLLVRRRSWPWLAHMPMMTVVFLSVSVVLIELVPLGLTGQWPNQIPALFFALDYTIWGISYWVILQASAGLIERMGLQKTLRPEGGELKDKHAVEEPPTREDWVEIEEQYRLVDNRCSYCGSKNEAGATKCTQCGAKL